MTLKPVYRRLLIFAVAVAALLVASAIYWFSAAREDRAVPREFLDARTRGAFVSQEIVANSGAVAAAIAEFRSSTSTAEQTAENLDNVSERVEQVRLQALELAGELEKMTRALPEVESVPARQAALESISERLALVSSLVQYTNKMKQLVGELRLRLTENAQNAEEINALVEEINAEVAAINNFNRSSNEAMERFDEAVQ